jgi:GNAT superfamily N-acetyltransferase
MPRVWKYAVGGVYNGMQSEMQRGLKCKHRRYTGMALKTHIERVTLENIAEHPQAICFINSKSKFYKPKVEWLAEQFERGLEMKMLYVEGVKRAIGFIEYVPGEFCWRRVNAKGYIFIHCLWTNCKKFQRQGLGRALLQEAEKKAKGTFGVAVMTSDKAFMADRQIFERNGYKLVSESGSEQLLVKRMANGPDPVFNPPGEPLESNKGLMIFYSRQCPWVPRFLEEAEPIFEESNLKPKIIELETPAEAQRAPSAYGAFSLIYDGRILADRYISTTRFKNILKKEIPG